MFQIERNAKERNRNRKLKHTYMKKIIIDDRVIDMQH